MKYKISKDSNLGIQLLELDAKRKHLNKQAKIICKELGADSIATNNRHLAGGIDALFFKEDPDKHLWRRVGQSWQGLWYPKAKNKAVNEKINALPVMDFDELNDLVGFKAGFVSSAEGIGHVKCVGMQVTKTWILIEVHEACDYKPVPDMIEITVSAYNLLALKKEKEPANENN